MLLRNETNDTRRVTLYSSRETCDSILSFAVDRRFAVNGWVTKQISHCSSKWIVLGHKFDHFHKKILP